jgi:hypothetical protein
LGERALDTIELRFLRLHLARSFRALSSVDAFVVKRVCDRSDGRKDKRALETFPNPGKSKQREHQTHPLCN